MTWHDKYNAYDKFAGNYGILHTGLYSNDAAAAINRMFKWSNDFATIVCDPLFEYCSRDEDGECYVKFYFYFHIKDPREARANWETLIMEKVFRMCKDILKDGGSLIERRVDLNEKLLSDIIAVCKMLLGHDRSISCEQRSRLTASPWNLIKQANVKVLIDEFDKYFNKHGFGKECSSYKVSVLDAIEKL
jgi:hypothetical protein